MNLQQLTNEVNETYYTNSSSYKTISSIQSELLELMGSSKDIKKINRIVILNYFQELQRRGNKPATIDTKMSYLSKCMRYAVDNRLIEFKPTIPYTKVKKQKAVTINLTTYNTMIQYCIANNLTELRQVVMIGYNTGIRISNILSLQPSDIDHNYIRVYQNKTNNPYSVPINDNIRELMSEFEGFTMNYRQIQYQYSKMIKALQLDARITIHTLRHSTCTRLVEQGIQPQVIQKIMNHKNISTTMLYTHIKDELLEQAVSVL